MLEQAGYSGLRCIQVQAGGHLEVRGYFPPYAVLSPSLPMGLLKSAPDWVPGAGVSMWPVSLWLILPPPRADLPLIPLSFCPKWPLLNPRMPSCHPLPPPVMPSINSPHWATAESRSGHPGLVQGSNPQLREPSLKLSVGLGSHFHVLPGREDACCSPWRKGCLRRNRGCKATSAPLWRDQEPPRVLQMGGCYCPLPIKSLPCAPPWHPGHLTCFATPKIHL